MEGGELFNQLIKRTKPFTEQGFALILFKIKKNLLQKFIFLEVAKMMYQICSAVNDLHQKNIAHRGFFHHIYLI